MSLKAFFCEESFGSSWTDTVTMSSTHSAPSNEPASGCMGAVGRMMTSVRSWRSQRRWRRGGGHWGPVEYQPVGWMETVRTLGSRGLDSLLGSWAIRSGQMRLMADVGRVVAWSMVLAFLVWAGGGLGDGSVDLEARASAGVLKPWEAWRVDPFLQERMELEGARLKGQYYGLAFKGEGERDIQVWWKEQEERARHIIAAPDTISGGFT